MIRITTTGKSASPETQGAQPSASSTPPADRTVGGLANGSTGGNGSPVRTNPLKSNTETDADGADAKRLRQSAPENTGWRARL